MSGMNFGTFSGGICCWNFSDGKWKMVENFWWKIFGGNFLLKIFGRLGGVELTIEDELSGGLLTRLTGAAMTVYMEEKLLVTSNNQPTTIDMANVEQSASARWKADICKYGFPVHCCCQKTFSHWTNLLILFVRNLVRKNMFSKQVLHCDCFHSGAGSTSRASCSHPKMPNKYLNS